MEEFPALIMRKYWESLNTVIMWLDRIVIKSHGQWGRKANCSLWQETYKWQTIGVHVTIHVWCLYFINVSEMYRILYEYMDTYMLRRIVIQLTESKESKHFFFTKRVQPLLSSFKTISFAGFWFWGAGYYGCHIFPTLPGLIN